MSSSSTSQYQAPPSSSGQPSDTQAWQKLVNDAAKPKTPAQIRAAGDIKVKVGVLWLVGITCSILAFFGGIVFILTPEHAKDIWVIIAPIITAGLTGTIAFLTGEKAGSSK
ncbi:hypothetical protein IG509_16805 [Vibrio cholerae]|uniref:hypothetical protein n=1 Tax=Vibrio cholerae TaxID=666 RepID=UPI0011D5434C|nr:hypothetical protein [Vibrio cholerae]EGQ8202427.1 hypothetical protein [Vibrio cholerae]EGR2428064.1 hypothetical protein [Vibrio cholerae]KAA1223261.1 hypothetical protein F0Q18_17775 [Vibrio cholerae]MCX9543153.1 hypothetical protein [Vibrio cholerae]TXZ69817.1 hypothetical protein FXE20_19250 [Vibrio cholerae]